MNRSALAALALVSLLLAVLAGCGGPGARESRPHDAAVDRTLSAPIVVAERLEVPRTLELYGTVEADRTASVSSRVTAQVTVVHAAAGDAVRRGQVLLEIDPQAARGQVAQARGALAQASAALALAERNYERYRALAESEAASELELDMARMEYERSRGAVEQAEGALAAASSVAADSRVTAPFDGRIVRRMVEVGDLATPGRPLLTLESGTTRRAALRVPESTVAAGDLSIGSPVAVRVDARPDLGVLTGRVVEMSPGADPMAHAYDVKVELPATDAPPATGSAVRAAVPVGTREGVAVPADAVLSRGGLDLVVTVGEEGATASRAVTVGGTLPDGRVEILSGLQGGERVVLGLDRVPPAGTTVRPDGLTDRSAEEE